MREIPDAWVSMSVTTRKPREGEVDGVHYRFASPEEFQELVDEDGLLEWATYGGNCYGTPRATVEEHIACGDQVILEIDVQGGFQVRDKFPSAHLVFIEPPSLDVLEARLRGRGTETEEVIAGRLKRAMEESEEMESYDYILVNDTVDQCVEELHHLIQSQHLKAGNSRTLMDRIKTELHELAESL